MICLLPPPLRSEYLDCLRSERVYSQQNQQSACGSTFLLSVVLLSPPHTRSDLSCQDPAVHSMTQAGNPRSLGPGSSHCPGLLQSIIDERDVEATRSLPGTSDRAILDTLSTEGRQRRAYGAHRCQQARRYVGAQLPVLEGRDAELHGSAITPAADFSPMGVAT